jgi:hypothetical protein
MMDFSIFYSTNSTKGKVLLLRNTNFGFFTPFPLFITLGLPEVLPSSPSKKIKILIKLNLFKHFFTPKKWLCFKKFEPINFCPPLSSLFQSFHGKVLLFKSMDLVTIHNAIPYKCPLQCKVLSQIPVPKAFNFKYL